MWKSSFEKIVGDAPDESKEQVMKYFDRVFDNQKSLEGLLEDKEVEKTMDEIKIISLSNKITNDLREKYGLPPFDVPFKNIHIVDRKKWSDVLARVKLDRNVSGFYGGHLQGIVVKETNSNLETFSLILHEMIHFKSYNALQIVESKDKSDKKAKQYRVGLEMRSRRDDNKGYFININEAVTELLTMELMKKNMSNPLFKNEAEKTKELNKEYYNDLSGDTFLIKIAKLDKENLFSLTPIKFAYKNERMVLKELVEKLYEKNSDKFNNSEEVMDLFKEGAITGNMMKYGRLIDKTFGSGTLRKIGEFGSDTKSQEDFIKSL
jgi:hypothetical protein